MKRQQKKRSAPEQAELPASPGYQFNMNRRNFFGALGSGIAISFTVASGFGKALGEAATPEDQVSAWIHVGENGTITVYTGKAEVGQNIRTSLAQVVAEELFVPMESIVMVMGDTELTPYDRGTFGSLSTPRMGPQLRKAAATARELLIDMAAERWKADRSQLFVEGGQVKNRNTTQAVDIGQLTGGKKILKPVNDNASLVAIEKWKIAGTSVPKVNGESFVTGQHKYVSDMKLPDMLFGKILRAPFYGASLASVDLSAARSMKGVVAVHDGDFVGVAAADLNTATKALKSIKAEWKGGPAQPSRAEIFTHLKKHAGPASERDGDTFGDVNSSFPAAEVKLEKTFHIDYIAHVPLEPRAGMAQWVGNKLTVWTGTQRPFGVQEDLAGVFHMPKENIRVIQPDTGSGYGGKHTGEAGIEAARLAKEAGKPVKVVWTREEEFTWAYFRPAGVIDVRAGADRDGVVNTWEFHNYNSGGSGIYTPYEIANKKIQFHPSDSPLRQGSYRGLAATANVFARESVMDDLAHALNMDPLDFRLKNLTDERMKGVLLAASEKFGWSAYKASAHHGIGIACGDEKGSYVATCAEVSVDQSRKVKILRVVTAFECGGIINPNHLENQIMGALVQGLGGALFERVDFKEGKIMNASLSRYRVPRFHDVPPLEIVMVNRKDIPSVGAGETPILGIAPAIRNAIAQATGQRLTTLPLIPNGIL
jgi:nicotinate dehydrogenase subunit B